MFSHLYHLVLLGVWCVNKRLLHFTCPSVTPSVELNSTYLGIHPTALSSYVRVYTVDNLDAGVREETLNTSLN